MNKFLILLFAPISCFLSAEGLPVWVFDKTIHLPSNCTFAARPSVMDESNVRFICESSDMNEKEDAWIWFKKYQAKNLEELKRESSVRKLVEEKLGILTHYSFSLEEHGETKAKSDLVCDEEICIHIVGSLKSEVSTFVISQFQ